MSEPTSEERRFTGATKKLTRLDDVAVAVNDDQRLTVEFRIADLVRRLVPEGDLAGSCGGCNGCSGCSM